MELTTTSGERFGSGATPFTLHNYTIYGIPNIYINREITFPRFLLCKNITNTLPLLTGGNSTGNGVGGGYAASPAGRGGFFGYGGGGMASGNGCTAGGKGGGYGAGGGYSSINLTYGTGSNGLVIICYKL